MRDQLLTVLTTELDLEVVDNLHNSQVVSRTACCTVGGSLLRDLWLLYLVRRAKAARALGTLIVIGIIGYLLRLGSVCG